MIIKILWCTIFGYNKYKVIEIERLAYSSYPPLLLNGIAFSFIELDNSGLNEEEEVGILVQIFIILVLYILFPLLAVRGFVNLLDKIDYEYFIGSEDKDAEVGSFFLYNVSQRQTKYEKDL